MDQKHELKSAKSSLWGGVSKNCLNGKFSQNLKIFCIFEGVGWGSEWGWCRHQSSWFFCHHRLKTSSPSLSSASSSSSLSSVAVNAGAIVDVLSGSNFFWKLFNHRDFLPPKLPKWKNSFWRRFASQMSQMINKKYWESQIMFSLSSRAPLLEIVSQVDGKQLFQGSGKDWTVI